METDIALIILLVAGGILLLLFAFSFRSKIKADEHELPELGDVEDVLTDDASSDTFSDVLTHPAAKEYNQQLHKINQVSVNKPTVEMEAPPQGFMLKPNPAQSNNAASKHRQDQHPQTRHNQEDMTTTKIHSNHKANLPLPRDSKLIIVQVQAKSGDHFSGYELLQVLLAANLRFGDMSIFHHFEKPNGEGKCLFSLAQSKEPGTFDLDAMGAVNCDGLTLFMQLKGSEHNHAALRLFLRTAERLAQELNADILDETRQRLSVERRHQFTQQVQAHIRSLNMVNLRAVRETIRVD